MNDVDPLAAVIQINGNWQKIGILPNGLGDGFRLLGEKPELRLEDQSHCCPGSRSIGRREINLCPGACFPEDAGISVIMSTFDNHPVCEHERAEEAHTELADQITPVT